MMISHMTIMVGHMTMMTGHMTIMVGHMTMWVGSQHPCWRRPYRAPKVGANHIGMKCERYPKIMMIGPHNPEISVVGST